MNVSASCKRPETRGKDVSPSNQEVGGADEDDRNWRGIIIALFVIITILGLVIVAIIIVTPKSDEDAVGEPFSIEEVFSAEFMPKKFEANWVNNEETNAYVYRSTDDGHLYVFDVDQNESTLIIDDIVFKNLGAERYSVSSDLAYVLLACNVQQVNEHSYDASYHIYRLHQPEPGARVIAFPQNENMEWTNRRLQFATWSTHGHSLTFVYGNNVFFQANPFTAAVRLTEDGSPLVRNGIPNWIYEEEILHGSTGHWLSPDQRFVAYLQFNDTTLPRIQLPVYSDPTDIYSTLHELPYPKAGDESLGIIPSVKLFIAETSNTRASHRFIAPPSHLRGRDHYITLVRWRDSSHLLVTWSNRAQNNATVTVCNAISTDCQQNLVETAPDGRGWVSIDDVWFTRKGQLYLTVLDEKIGKTGHWKHVTLVTNPTDATGHRTFLTYGAWDVVKIVGVDEQESNSLNGQHIITVYFISRPTDGDPRARHLFRLSTDTHRVRRPSAASTVHRDEPECLSCSRGPDCQYVDAVFSPSTVYYIESCLGPGLPQYSLRTTVPAATDEENNKPVQMLEDNAALREKLATKALPKKEFIHIQTPDGEVLWGQVSLPPLLNKEHITQYPVLIHACNGPGTQSVTFEFQLDWSTHLSTSHGVIYASVDARGSSGHGSRFQFATHRQLGTLEVDDHVALVTFFRNLHYVDKDRIGIWGTTYGGFVVARVLGEKYNTTVDCGIALSPITDWRYHEVVHTERLMGIDSSADNYRAYDNANVSQNAANFKGKQFLLIHGTADDRVHFQNSAQLMKSLSEAGVLFDAQVYPDLNRRSVSPATKLHLYHSMTKFLHNDCWEGIGPHDVVTVGELLNRKMKANKG